jgi:histidinol-phosphatase (PHP family)
MPWANYHTHSSFCDGKAEPEAYIEEAIKNNVVSLGFSSHSPVPVDNNWSMPEDRFDEYLDTITLLKEKYKDKLDIYTGLEIDYILDVNVAGGLELSGLDYTIGSVHFLGKKGLRSNWTVDSKIEEMGKGVETDFRGDIKKAVEMYYISMQEMIKNTNVNIIGHLDIIKKNNHNNRLFNEQEKWYIDLVDDTLKLALRYSKIIEVNNGGITRKKINALYPGNWILEKCHEMTIPITMSSDAHSPEQIVAGFSGMAKILNGIGFTEVFVLENKKWKPVKFSPEGISVIKP